MPGIMLVLVLLSLALLVPIKLGIILVQLILGISVTKVGVSG